MDDETLSKIMKKSSQSFGIHGTVERLRIFYLREDIMDIQSEPGKGTTVTLTVPAILGDDAIE